MSKKNKSILHATVWPHPGSVALNIYLNNNDFKCDYLTMYPLFKLDKSFKIKNTVIKKSFFSTFFSTLYFFLYRYEKNRYIKKINILVQRIAYSSISNFIIKNVNNYDIFIIQASLGKDCLPFLKNKITLLDKYSEHVSVGKKISEKEFKKKKLKIPFEEFYSTNSFLINQELNEYKIVNKIVLPSKFAYKTFIDEGYNPSKLHIVEMSGIDFKKFYLTSYPNKETFEILFMGRLTLNKGIDYLIESFKNLNIKNKRLKMYGVISEDGKEYFKNMKLPKDVEILSTVRFNNLKYIYSKSDVLVQPSLFDGFSNVVTQALACGCPVVTTSNTGASDVVKDGVNGYVVPIMDSESITQSLYKIYDEKNKSSFSRDNIAKSVAQYKDWNKYSIDYKELIETF